MPTVSVIIPTYNSARYIREAIDSVLGQTYGDYEIIVVDDGSTDNTAEIIQPYRDRITYIYQSNQKLPVARNTGIAASSGQYLAFLDSDDLFLPHKLATQAGVLDERPDIGLVAGGYQYVDENGRLIKEHKSWINRPVIDLETIITGGLVPPVAVLLRRSWFNQVGGFDPQMIHSEDMDLWFRLALAGCPMTWSPSIVSQYRLHLTNQSRSHAEQYSYYRRALERAFSNDKMPDQLRVRDQEIYALTYLSQASRSFMDGYEEEARDCIHHAIAIDPSLQDNGGQRLAQFIVGLQYAVWSSDQFDSFVVSVLSGGSAAEFSRTVAVVKAKKRFYEAYADQCSTEVQRAWLEVARREIGWLGNRGAWSILGQSFIRYKNQ